MRISMTPVLVLGAIVAESLGVASAFYLGYVMGRKDKIYGSLPNATPK
jgi:hypothetical protein